MGQDGAQGERNGEEGKKEGEKLRLLMMEAAPEVLLTVRGGEILSAVSRGENGTDQTRTGRERGGEKCWDEEERLQTLEDQLCHNPKGS